MYNKNFSFPTFSLAFLLVGMPIIYIVREYLAIPKSMFTYTFEALLLLGLINFKNIIQLKFYNNKPKLFMILLITNILFFLFNAIAYNQLNHPESLFIILTLILILALSSQTNVIFKQLPEYVLVISSITSVVSILFNTHQWILEGRFYVGDTHNPNLSSFIAMLNILMIIYDLYLHKKRAIIIKLFLVLIGFVSFYIYIISFSKSAILGLLFTLDYLLFINKSFVLNLIKNLIILIFIFIPIALYLFPQITEAISKNMMVLQYAYDSYFYGAKGSLSAEIRHYNLEHMKEYLHTISLFSNQGIFTTRADQPMLQVFTDLGLISGLLNILTMIIFPLIIVFKSFFILKSYKSDKLYNLYIFAILIFLFYLPNNFFHGTPYEYTIWLPILIIYKLTPWSKKISNE